MRSEYCDPSTTKIPFSNLCDQIKSALEVLNTYQRMWYFKKLNRSTDIPKTWIPLFIMNLSLLIPLSVTLPPENTSHKLTLNTREKLRILAAFSHPGKSHFDLYKPLLEELAKRGHDVTVISHFPKNNDTNESLPNYKDISIAGSSRILLAVRDLSEVDTSFLKFFNSFLRLREYAIKDCKKGLNVPEVRQLIDSGGKFDLMITESFNSDCFLGFVHRFQAPFITIVSDMQPQLNSMIGNPDNPSYIPGLFTEFSPSMSFIQRVINTLYVELHKILYEVGIQWYIQKSVDEVFGPGVPPLSEIAKKTSAVLTNSHYSIFGAVPYLPNVVEVGGLHIQSQGPLPKDIKTFLDDSPEGVLLISWGSMIKTSTLPKKILDDVLKVIGSIPRKVIWKWETEKLPGKPSNLMIRKWLPQFDIMDHPNVKAYLSHGGLLGLSEGVYVGLPMVIVPMYGDQFHNAAAAEARGAAVIVKYDELDEITLKSALDKVFNDTRYQENARALSRAYRDRPATPLETAVWWSEFIARGNGRRYLRSEGADLPWYQYYLLDVFLFLAGVLLTTLYVTYRLMKFLLFLSCSRKSSKTTDLSDSQGKKDKKKNQ